MPKKRRCILFVKYYSRFSPNSQSSSFLLFLIYPREQNRHFFCDIKKAKPMFPQSIYKWKRTMAPISITDPTSAREKIAVSNALIPLSQENAPLKCELNHADTAPLDSFSFEFLPQKNMLHHSFIAADKRSSSLSTL